jgi:mannose-6-phosphate isomerase-like protein (cupin superfamily)
VTVSPGKSGDDHSTEIYEEMIVVLEGQGQVRIANQKNLDIKYGNIALIPPNTEHQVFNTGTGNFKYIYIATKTKH